MMTRFRLLHWLRSSLWLIPVLCVLGGVGLSFGTIVLDGAFARVARPIYAIGHETALAILSTVAASMVSLAALILTITMVVVQLAMGQFSPRIVRTFLRDRPNQYAVGVFVATFAHSIIAMSFVAPPEGGNPGKVPGLAIVFAFAMVIVSIIVLVHYVDHIGQSLRVAALIDSVGDDLRSALNTHFPSRLDDKARPGDDPEVLLAPSEGVVFHVDHQRLVAEAARRDCVLELLPMVGDFVPRGAPLLRARGGTPGAPERLLSLISIGPERTMHQDPAYGFRLLVDMAVRSLGDQNDPTTAVQAIDRIHASLRQLVDRAFPSGEHSDPQERVRLRIRTLTWQGLVSLAFDEVRIYGGDSPQVVRRLRAALNDLCAVAPPARQPPLERQLELLDSTGKDQPADQGRTGDGQGIGSGPDMAT